MPPLTPRPKNALLVAALALTAAAPPPQPLPAAQDRAARLTIPVMVDGHGPYPFVVDTGADRSVISRELAATLHLPPGRPVTLHDTGGVQPVETVAIGSLAFGQREITDVQAPILAEANLGADGMLGIDALRDQHVVMDFTASRFLASDSRWEVDKLAPYAIVVEGHNRFGQLVLTDADSQSVPILVIVDSGAQNTVGNAALRRLMQLGTTHGTRPPTGHVISVTGTRTPADVDEMPEIRLGGVTLSHVPIAYADLHTFRQFRLEERPALLLGMDVLHLFRSVTVDFRRREALFVTK